MTHDAYLENAWYCAAFSHEVGEGLLARTLLDRPVLISRDAQGLAHAIGDTCPHRFSPLNTGKRLGDTVECPYHGLRFDLASGACVHNPHGSGRIPAAARTPGYPVVERQGVVWFWPGDPALADPALIEDPHVHREGAVVQGYNALPTDYRLLLDNLLDSGSHAPYVHGSLATPGVVRESDFKAGDRWVDEKRVTRNVETPGSQKFIWPHERGDFHAEARWTAPSTIAAAFGMTEPGAPSDTGAMVRVAHLFTPETATSTHYFWLVSRDRALEDRTLDAGMRRQIEKTFIEEDVAVVAASQDRMAGREFFSLQPIYLEPDKGIRYRRILDDLIAAQSSPTLARSA